MNGDALAAAARSLIGTPFRLHGRNPAHGLDCVGVIAAALAMRGIAAKLPCGYPLRMRRMPDLAALADAAGFETANGAIAPGDILLLQAGPCQLHLAMATERGRAVHAHAGLGRVVESRLPAEWPVLRHWRTS